MTNPISRMKTGWWSFALPGYRDHPTPATYSLFSYENLPPVVVPSLGNWRWLETQPPAEQWALSSNTYPDGSNTDLSQLPQLTAEAPFELPAQFLTFMQSPPLHDRIRSCTACMLELSDFLVFSTNPPDGLIMQFLVDQQGCLRWYLYADAFGNHCVLVSGESYGLVYDPDEVQQDQVDLIQAHMFVCAPSFEEFIYRFWLENEIWFSLAESEQPISKIYLDYLAHYRSRQ